MAEQCRGRRVIAVQDAWRLLPFADVLYACDAAWIRHHNGCPDFSGELWSSHDDGTNEKRQVAKDYGFCLVAGRAGDTFSIDPTVICYGSNSTFQAIGLAILFGATRIVLVGANMQHVNGRAHFYGDHPKPLRQCPDYRKFVPAFERAAKSLPAGVEIINCTPDSALRCFPMVSLEDALKC